MLTSGYGDFSTLSSAATDSDAPSPRGTRTNLAPRHRPQCRRPATASPTPKQQGQCRVAFRPRRRQQARLKQMTVALHKVRVMNSAGNFSLRYCRLQSTDCVRYLGARFSPRRRASSRRRLALRQTPTFFFFIRASVYQLIQQIDNIIPTENSTGGKLTHSARNSNVLLLYNSRQFLREHF